MRRKSLKVVINGQDEGFLRPMSHGRWYLDRQYSGMKFSKKEGLDGAIEFLAKILNVPQYSIRLSPSSRKEEKSWNNR